MERALPRVSAICGAKRAGKDVIAQHLASRFNYEVVKFATPLKEAMKILFDMTDAELETDLKDEHHTVWQTTPRALMQYLGTEVFQYGIQNHIPHVGRRFWAEKLFSRYRSGVGSVGGNTRIVISDLRFQHEVETIVKYYEGDYLLMRVNRDSDVLFDMGDNAGKHASEVEFQNIMVNACLRNNGTIQDLENKVDEIMMNFKML